MQREVRIQVQVAREDLPSTSASLELVYRHGSSQSQWPVFIERVRDLLGLQTVYLVLERETLLPVLTVLQLVGGGSYLVRQSESSSLVQMLASDMLPTTSSWPSIGQGNAMPDKSPN